MPSNTWGEPVHERDVEGNSYEYQAGYSRGARCGTRIAISGTTADAMAAAGGTYEQTRHCIQRVIASVERLGGARTDIIRTRLYLGPGAYWQDAARAHRELLGDVAPANTTLMVAGLVGDGILVELEADAEVPPGRAQEGGRRLSSNL
jgi:enamine deaminase RidA (YjgF/YER057c/UK114 family)